MKTYLKHLARRAGRIMNPDITGDIQRARHIVATLATAQYIEEHMPMVPSVADAFSVHDAAIEQAAIADGLVLEFGVFTGRSINHIASKRAWQVDGFDSFEGLPEFWRDGFGAGRFALNELPAVAPNVRLHKGWFDQTLPAYIEALPDRAVPVAYLHVDCDLYSSTRTIFDALSKNIVPGTVIVFDEYFNYPGWLGGEFKAFKEFIAAGGRRYEYIVYNRMHEQVAVRMI